MIEVQLMLTHGDLAETVLALGGKFRPFIIFSSFLLHLRYIILKIYY